MPRSGCGPPSSSARWFLSAPPAPFSISRANVAQREDHGWILLFVFGAAIVVFASWLLGILLSVAFMHLAVDIGRNLRDPPLHLFTRGFVNS